MTGRDDIRIGDAEREEVAAQLREHFAVGRLTDEEFDARLDAAYAAKTGGDLKVLTRDLPRPAGQPVARTAGSPRGGRPVAYGPRWPFPFGVVRLGLLVVAAWVIGGAIFGGGHAHPPGWDHPFYGLSRLVVLAAVGLFIAGRLRWRRGNRNRW